MRVLHGHKRRRIVAVSLMAGIAVLIIGTLATPANAEIVEGPCDGTALFVRAGTTMTAGQPADEVTQVLPEDTVRYEGSIDIDPPAEESDPPAGESNPPAGEIAFNGGVDVDLPLGQSWTVVTWTGQTMETSAKGEYAYTVPSFVPRGPILQVTGWHNHGTTRCVVTVSAQLEGEPGAYGLGAAAATVLFGAGTAAAGIKKKVA